MNTPTTFFTKAAELESVGIPFYVVTLIGTRGHAPQDPGAKAIVTSEGLEWGTVGGGKVEARAIQYCVEKLAEKPTLELVLLPEYITWNLQRDVGMSCGGEVSFLFERFGGHSWTVAVFGAGHISQVLIRQLLMLSCKIICLDTRSEWLDRMPKESRKLKLVLSENLAGTVNELPADAFCAVMTRGHATDLPVLEAILKRGNPPYVGVIGSTVKGIKIRKDLKELGFSDEQIALVRCPMGLEIHNRNDPAEIGFSIVAELIQQRSAVSARVLPQ